MRILLLPGLYCMVGIIACKSPRTERDNVPYQEISNPLNVYGGTEQANNFQNVGRYISAGGTCTATYLGTIESGGANPRTCSTFLTAEHCFKSDTRGSWSRAPYVQGENIRILGAVGYRLEVGAQELRYNDMGILIGSTIPAGIRGAVIADTGGNAPNRQRTLVGFGLPVNGQGQYLRRSTGTTVVESFPTFIGRVGDANIFSRDVFARADQGTFGCQGDSGAPLFDQDGKVGGVLWGVDRVGIICVRPRMQGNETVGCTQPGTAQRPYYLQNNNPHECWAKDQNLSWVVIGRYLGAEGTANYAQALAACTQIGADLPTAAQLVSLRTQVDGIRRSQLIHPWIHTKISLLTKRLAGNDTFALPYFGNPVLLNGADDATTECGKSTSAVYVPYGDLSMLDFTTAAQRAICARGLNPPGQCSDQGYDYDESTQCCQNPTYEPMSSACGNGEGTWSLNSPGHWHCGGIGEEFDLDCSGLTPSPTPTPPPVLEECIEADLSFLENYCCQRGALKPQASACENGRWIPGTQAGEWICESTVSTTQVTPLVCAMPPTPTPEPSETPDAGTTHLWDNDGAFNHMTDDQVMPTPLPIPSLEPIPSETPEAEAD